MKKLLIILCLLLVGCGNDKISNEELDAINNDIIIYLSNNQYGNLVFNYVDYEDNIVVVGLLDNSVEKQNDFKEKIVDSKYIKFIQSEVMNDDIKKEYTTNIPDIDAATASNDSLYMEIMSDNSLAEDVTCSTCSFAALTSFKVFSNTLRDSSID